MIGVERLYLEIITTERVMAGQEVDLVEASGAAGEFGVLPGHAAFLTTLIPGEIRFMAGAKTTFIATSGGFAEVLDNKVTLLLDAAEFREEIDIERALKARERAEAALKALSTDHDEYREHEAALHRAIVRISTASRQL